MINCNYRDSAASVALTLVRADTEAPHNDWKLALTMPDVITNADECAFSRGYSPLEIYDGVLSLIAELAGPTAISSDVV